LAEKRHNEGVDLVSIATAQTGRVPRPVRPPATKIA